MPRNARTPRDRSSGPAVHSEGRRPSASGRPTHGDSSASRTPARITAPALPPVTDFSELDLPPAILAELGNQGITAPFPIQAATLPNTLSGRDVLGRGRTGSGKTLAFGLALLARNAGRRAEPRRPLALVLVPTRELAQQVTDALTPYADAVRLRLTTVVGGMSLSRQANALKRGVEVLVATPGRLADLIERGDCDLGRVEITVLDEADQMADMGFLPQVTRLLGQVAPGGQRMLFSATLDRDVDRLVRRFLQDPITHSVDPSAGAVTTMEHHLLHVTEAAKLDATAHIGARDGRVIMFVGMKHAADRLARKLLANGVRAAALHGGRTQSQRNRTLEAFRSGDVTVLVATNVAARGIHVDDLDLVVNVDPPTDHKDYLHRGGRTARAGASGTVVTLVLPNQRREMDRLMTAAGISPTTTRVQPGDSELARITGARTPSGVPITLQAAAGSRAPSSEGRGSGGRGSSGRSGGRRRPRHETAGRTGRSPAAAAR
ncbi:superfamily II DNA/RNA helicase [Thermomonospora umbrina]|uniref:Superfamily II DNA/RNA helicase n=1 Tax=Thermomonospora umbrina TaxID=111806 RepID=A0A3D9SRW8_9ACTN|nr:superfamily II DNA/RNA helicase [Thermomonospora umbrina]